LSCCRAGEEDVGRQLDLGDAEAVAEIQASALSGAEPWCELGGPVRAALGDDVWSEALTSCLQRVQVIDVQKRIVVLAEPNAQTSEFLGQERVAIQVTGDRERQECGDA